MVMEETEDEIEEARQARPGQARLGGIEGIVARVTAQGALVFRVRQPLELRSVGSENDKRGNNDVSTHVLD